MLSPTEIKELSVEDVERQLGELVASQDPLIIGVRHHSPTLSAQIGAMLDAFKPDVVLIEMPMEFDPWLEWLGHAELSAPVALAAVDNQGDGLSFYPFADFSPELSAVRWAVENNVEIHPCDLPAGIRMGLSREYNDPEDTRTLTPYLEHRFRADGFESLWDRMVEVHASANSPEALRRAGLYVGWSLRHDAIRQGGIPELDLAREHHMRNTISAHAGKRIAVVVGAFHGPALIGETVMWSEPETPLPVATTMVTSLIPYAFDLLDSRSMYPAGIRDPMWQQRIFEAVRDTRPFEDVVADVVVEICREMRERGHVAGVPDADAAARMTLELANLRNLPSPGRQELIESIQTAMARGEVLGRGRVLAQAMERVMVGRGRGRLAGGTPRSGLAPYVEEKLESLGLPGPTSRSQEPKPFRLDPLRSERDRARHIALVRLRSCTIPYGEERNGQAIGATETITRVWDVSWQPSTDAMLELASIWGATLEQASHGALRQWESVKERRDEFDAAAMLVSAQRAAECGLHDATTPRIARLATDFLDQADFRLVLSAIGFLESVEQDHIPGLQGTGFTMPAGVQRRDFMAAAVRAIEGVAGSNEPSDAQDLIELVALLRHQSADDELGVGKLVWIADEFAANGSPTMQGAATAAQLILDRIDNTTFGSRLSSWLDAAAQPALRRTLSERLSGLLVAAGVLLESDIDALEPLVSRIHSMPDVVFMKRLPALRRGFDVLSASARARLMEGLADSFPESLDPRGHIHDFELADHPEVLAIWTEADRAGRDAVEFLYASPPPTVTLDLDSEGPKTRQPVPAPEPFELQPLDRWRLILGREREKLQGQSARLATALDQLYGGAGGEGSGGHIGGQGGGKEDGFPTAREWADELNALFGDRVRDEVLAQAAQDGNRGALFELDTETVQPSVELLETVLSLKGGMSEGQLEQLRRLVKRVVDELVKELATRLRPALTGLTTPRPTIRKGGPIDLRRTIQANLKNTWRDGEVTRVIPERVYFKTRARKSMDWHVTLVVDVSGSMEPSVIYSALMAAILQGLPALEVNFYAFNTEVIDLTEFVDDPLSLLLEVDVGGGTHIAKALRYARQRMTVPNRSIIILISDFEEGWSAGSLIEEVRQLAESGAHPLGLAALDDRGQPRYNKAIASLCVGAGMPVAALTPLELARWVGEKIHG